MMKRTNTSILSPATALFLTAFFLTLNSPRPHAQGAAQASLLGFDIQPGPPASQALDLRSSGGALFFIASEVPFQSELWRIDVSGAGQVLVAEPLTSGTAARVPQWVTDVGGTVFFVATEFANPGSGRELWKTNGTVAGTVMVADIATQPNSSSSSSPNHLVASGGMLFFTADDNVNGRELWKSDGTAGGTVLVADIRPGSGDAFTNSNFPVLPTDVNGTLYFFADDGSTGCELWKSDGTAGGTALVADINPGGSSGPRPLNPGGQLDDSFTGVSFNGELVFLADDGTNGMELWKSDGSGASMIRDIVAGPTSGAAAAAFSGLVELDGFLYFAAVGSQLWRTDGSSAGTTMVHNFTGAALGDLIVFQGQLIFGTSAGPSTEKLWSTDGTSLQLIRDLAAGSFLEIDGLLFFSGNDGVFGDEIWQTDGTSAGTILAADVFVGGGSSARELTSVDNALFFIADDELIGREVHVISPPEPGPTQDSASNLRFAGTSVDPVNTRSGELFTEGSVDLDLGGPLPLVFTRYYGSYLKRSRVGGDLGNNWLHNFDASMTQAGNSALYISAEGRVTSFSLNAGIWTQLDSTDTPYQMTLDPGMDAVLFDSTLERILTFDFTSGGPVVGKLLQIADGRGNAHTLSYDGGTGQLLSVSDGVGRMLLFTYNADAQPKIAQVSDGVRTVSYQYTDVIDPENLTQVIDVAGGMTSFVYADTSGGLDFGLLSSKQRPEFNTPFTQAYYDGGTPGSEGRVESQSDAGGNSTRFDYLGADTVITNPLLNARIHSHSAAGALTGIEDEAGLQFTMGSDASGRRSSVTDRNGRVTAYTYDASSGKLATVVDAGGVTTTLQYTSRIAGGVEHRDLTRITFGDGTTREFTLDAAGNPIATVDALGNVQSATYDAQGQPLTETNELGGVTANVYSADGTQQSRTDPAGNLTTFGHDAFRRLNVVNRADGTTQAFTYDASNRLATTRDPNGNTALFGYDGNGNVTDLTDRLGNLTMVAYDANDRPTGFTDALGNTTLRGYDAQGRIDRRTDANGNATLLAYDSRRRLTGINLPGGEVIGMQYDSEGILTRRTDPLGNSTSFSSDALGRITRSTSPLGFAREVAYDALGRTISSTDALGQRTIISRDARGLVTGIALPGSAGTVAYDRDALGGATRITDAGNNVWLRTFDDSGRRTSMSDPLGRAITWGYDNLNRLSTLSYPGALGTMELSYDANGNLTRALGSTGEVLDFTYDAEDCPRTGTGWTISYDAAGRIVSTNGISVTRDSGGRIATTTLAVGRTVTYAYDANDRLTSITDWNGATTTLAYDAAGQRTGIMRPSGLHTTEAWDADGRLATIAEGAVSTIALTRNGNGQITEATRNLPETPSAQGLTSSAATFNAGGEQSGSTYDELGRLVARGSANFTWNQFSRLTNYDLGSGPVSATYDSAGRRLSRTQGGSTRDYVWNLALGLASVEIEREGGADLHYYIHTPEGELLYSIEAGSGARTFYHFDETGNTTFLSDDTGAVIASYAYTPFGVPLSSTGAVENPFTWQGRLGVMDEGLGLYYVRARYYDSQNGRFLSRDPAGSIGPLSVNPYQYANLNPLLFVDATGQTPERTGFRDFRPLIRFNGSSNAVATHGIPISLRTVTNLFVGAEPSTPTEVAERNFLLGIPEVTEIFEGVRRGLQFERDAQYSPASLFVRAVVRDFSPPIGAGNPAADFLLQAFRTLVFLILERAGEIPEPENPDSVIPDLSPVVVLA